MKVSRYDYKSQFADLDSLVDKIRSMLKDGHYVLSEEVNAFESALGAFVQSEHAVGTGCGTDAILLALRAAGIGPGDQVVTAANTFHATVSAIIWSGAQPVLVDADEHTFTMNPKGLSGIGTDRLRCIIPVHLYGRPCPMKPILDFARQNDLVVIEDAAQAIGALSDGVPVGSIGDLGCFSFHPSKNLAAAGDGGAVTTSSLRYAESIRVLRSLGQGPQNEHIKVGVNSKLDAIQAAVLHAKLPLLAGWNERRRALAAVYRERLQDLPLGFQSEDLNDVHVYHLFKIQTPHRDALRQHLQEHGIDAVVRYPQPIHLQQAFAEQGWREGQFPVAEKLARELVALPLHPTLSEAEIDYTCSKVRSFFDGGKRA